ncbi:MAG: response regulator [Anaerolineae bacterium]|nr:response regulator [Anaerolineae bacterium]
MDPREQARALIVDDDPAWQEIVGEILRDDGLAVDLASNLEEATLLLRQRPHRVAVVDLALGPGAAANQDGLQVLATVRRHDPGCVTILLTGYATVPLAVEVLTSYGALSCLTKASFDRAEFQRLISRALSVAPVLGPVSPERAAGTSERVGVVSEPGRISDSVLVVDDDAGWRSILSELLTDAGYQVRLCNSYGEALGCLRREHYAVAVVDLALSEVPHPLDRERVPAGYRLLEQVQAGGGSAIVVSGMANPNEIRRVYGDYDLFAYLEKQAFDRRAFLQAVSEACECHGAAQALDVLTPRELEVLGMLVQGLTNKQLAASLFISTNTVKRHLKAIYGKLEVHTRAAAVAKAVSSGLIVETDRS